ncbi:hypothetical protein SISNIDRAFT_325994 [Sistotremastrum niveocremeum HHB9708]|uniref:Uncharacterized protein n=1 Tax=Sistotremastrum niveocremeum HHB9708 TaxID=1314777 RepID=A0A164XAJ5_9AGAM|nr:hypothetical protein SISNIDRAFT_325994 [Sistotremastrum niveocremeum HHB9708]
MSASPTKNSNAVPLATPRPEKPPPSAYMNSFPVSPTPVSRPAKQVTTSSLKHVKSSDGPTAGGSGAAQICPVCTRSAHSLKKCPSVLAGSITIGIAIRRLTKENPSNPLIPALQRLLEKSLARERAGTTIIE